MAYRAPELFDVKTGVTLDEKADIWVSQWLPVSITHNSDRLGTVTWMHAVRTCVLTFAIREYADYRARWFNSDGSDECTIQASRLGLFAGP